jgi:hypothetical protein
MQGRRIACETAGGGTRQMQTQTQVQMATGTRRRRRRLAGDGRGSEAEQSRAKQSEARRRSVGAGRSETKQADDAMGGIRMREQGGIGFAATPTRRGQRSDTGVMADHWPPLRAALPPPGGCRVELVLRRLSWMRRLAAVTDFTLGTAPVCIRRTRGFGRTARCRRRYIGMRPPRAR